MWVNAQASAWSGGWAARKLGTINPTMSEGSNFMRVSASITIDLPIREVFAFAGNPSCWPEWITGVSAVEMSSSRCPEAGLTFEQTENTASHYRRSSWQVVEYEPPHVSTSRRITEPSGLVRQVLESVEGSTRCTVSTEGDTTGPFTSGPEVERAIRARLEQDLARLKALLEEQASGEEQTWLGRRERA